MRTDAYASAQFFAKKTPSSCSPPSPSSPPPPPPPPSSSSSSPPPSPSTASPSPRQCCGPLSLLLRRPPLPLPSSNPSPTWPSPSPLRCVPFVTPTSPIGPSPPSVLFYSLLFSLSLSLSSLSRPDLLLSLLHLRPPSIPFSSPTHFNRLLLSLSSHPSSLPSALSLLRSFPSPPPSPSAPSTSSSLPSPAPATSASRTPSSTPFSRPPHFTPDADTYRLLTQALCRKSQLGTAHHLLDDMHNKGMAADKLTYSNLLNNLEDIVRRALIG